MRTWRGNRLRWCCFRGYRGDQGGTFVALDYCSHNLFNLRDVEVAGVSSALPYRQLEVLMTPQRFFSGVVVAAAIAFAAPSFAQKPANAPKNATAQCTDGTYSAAKTKRDACVKHGGVKSWWGTPAVGKGATKPHCNGQRRGLGGALAPKVFCD
jgi:Protein of unknown function (DUF3761)